MTNLKVLIAIVGLSLTLVMPPVGLAAHGAQTAQLDIIPQAIPLSVSPSPATVRRIHLYSDRNRRDFTL